MDLNKKRETELQRLRRDLEESSVQSEALAASLRKRHSDTVSELSEQCEALQRVRIKMEKEKQNLRMEVDELSASLETAQKTRVGTQCISWAALEDSCSIFCWARSFTGAFALQVSSESQVKKLEEQLLETTRRNDDLQRMLTELGVAKNRLTGHLKLLKLRQVRGKGKVHVTVGLCWCNLI